MEDLKSVWQNLDLDPAPGFAAVVEAQFVVDAEDRLHRHPSLAFGTQTGGSVIRPAAYCGVVGFKPSWGRYAIEGVKPLSRNLDTLGIFARSVRDIAFFDTALTGASHALASGPPRLAVFVPFRDQLEEAGAKAMEDAVRHLEAAGATIQEIGTIPTFDDIAAAHETIMIGEIGRALHYELENFPEYLNDYYRDNINRGASIPDDEIAIARNTLGKARKTLVALFENTDLILTPPASGPAPEGLEFTGDPLFNKIWTTLGWPCLTLPATKHMNSLPLGIQIVSPQSEISAFLANAAWVEMTLNQ